MNVPVGGQFLTRTTNVTLGNLSLFPHDAETDYLQVFLVFVRRNKVGASPLAMTYELLS